jgi:hypothetical protein
MPKRDISLIKRWPFGKKVRKFQELHPLSKILVLGLALI